MKIFTSMPHFNSKPINSENNYKKEKKIVTLKYTQYKIERY